MITLTYKSDSIVVNPEQIKWTLGLQNFKQNNTIEIEEETTFQELKTIVENLYYYQVSPFNELSQYYCVDQLYDSEYVEILRKNSNEITPQYSFLFSTKQFYKEYQPQNSFLEYIFSNIEYRLKIFEEFSENLVLGGNSVLYFLFGIRTKYWNLYIHSTDLNSFLRKIRKTITLKFTEDSEKIIFGDIIIYKQMFNSQEEIANSFDV